jgi:hypothetical protein
VLLRFFAGADWNEIAEIIGAPSGDAVAMECVRKVFPSIAGALALGGGTAGPPGPAP